MVRARERTRSYRADTRGYPGAQQEDRWRDPDGPAEQGHAALNDAVLLAFARVGGEDYVGTAARSNPRTFSALLGRVLPREVRRELGGEGRGGYAIRWAGERGR